MMSRLDELTRALSSWAPGDPPSATWFLPELRELLRAQFAGAYLPRATDQGWSLSFMHGAGEGAPEYVELFRDFVTALPPSESFLALGNPHLVTPEQRNRVMSLGQLAALQPRGDESQPFHTLFRTLGIAGHDQLRVLVCEGPRQLAWVGATREEAFTERETTILRRLREPLRRRLRLESQLGAPGLLAAAFDAALEAIPTAAFLLGSRHTIEAANTVGVALLDRDAAAVLASITHSERAGEKAGGYSLTEVAVPGCPPCVLAIRKESTRLLERVAAAAKSWRLSARQARVLELVATGASNKEIALALSCAESTVESRITQLFRRSGATSRAGLVGRLFEPPGT